MKKRRPKGRKIYKTKEKNYYGKSAGGKFISGCLTLVLMGGVGFLGYSVAGPMLSFDRKTGDNAEDIIPTSPDNLISIDSYTESVAAANEGDTEPEIVNEENISSYRQYRAAAVPNEALGDIDSLRAALESIPTDENIEYAEIPMKISGGNVLYSCSAFEAQEVGGKTAALGAEQIASAVQEYGFRPVAVISCFDDTNLPELYSTSGYSIGEDGELWRDAEGKAQVSPYSDVSLTYNSYIIREAVMSGFEKIICTDLEFPEFSDTELENMDIRLKSDVERTSVMTSAVNYLNDITLECDAVLMPEYSAKSIITGGTVLPVKSVINTESIIIDICIDEFADIDEQYEIDGTPAEITEKVLGYISGKTGELNTIIRISGKDLTYESLREAKNIAEAYGFSSFVIG